MLHVVDVEVRRANQCEKDVTKNVINVFEGTQENKVTRCYDLEQFGALFSSKLFSIGRFLGQIFI